MAGSTSGLAALLQAQVAENVSSYTPERWHLTLIMMAFLLGVGLMNHFTFRLIPWLELTAGILHVALFITFVAVLATSSPRRDTRSVWFRDTTSSGWSNRFVSFHIGMLTPAWGFIGRSKSTHRSILKENNPKEAR